jgi:hypothetical protein
LSSLGGAHRLSELRKTKNATLFGAALIWSGFMFCLCVLGAFGLRDFFREPLHLLSFAVMPLGWLLLMLLVELMRVAMGEPFSLAKIAFSTSLAGALVFLSFPVVAFSVNLLLHNPESMMVVVPAVIVLLWAIGWASVQLYLCWSQLSMGNRHGHPMFAGLAVALGMLVAAGTWFWLFGDLLVWDPYAFL